VAGSPFRGDERNVQRVPQPFRFSCQTATCFPPPFERGKRGCFTARRVTIQLSNSQAPSPAFFVEAPGSPVSLSPSKCAGDGAPSGATIVLSCRVPSRERGRLSARHRGVLPSGGRARFAGVLRLVDDRRQPAPGGQPVVATGWSPGAARVRACEARPQAPHSVPPT
jgi:hypothetical protein